MKITLLHVLLTVYFLLGADPVLSEAGKTSLETGMSSQDLTASMFKVIGGLLIVILSIFACAWFYRRFANLQSVNHDALKVIGGLSVTQKDRVVLLQVGEQQLLIGVSPGRIQTLHVLDNPLQVDEASNHGKQKFSTQLNMALKNWKSS